MRILLIGDGAREHIIAEQMARSAEVYCIMKKKNPGIAKITQKHFISDYKNIEAIGAWAIKEKIKLAFVVSETAQATGLSDVLEAAGIALASPNMAASVVGTNRLYAFNLMKEFGIDRPRFYICRSKADLDDAMEELDNPVVKPAIRVEWGGVKLADSDFKSKSAVKKYATELMKKHNAVILEKLVIGEEFNLHALSDGRKISTLQPVQVMRRAYEDGKGPLTEGMGSYSTGKLLPFMTKDDLDHAKLILQKIVDALRERGTEFKGVLNGQFMLTKEGIKMLDVRTTFGNPASINNLGILKTQFSEILSSIADGNLKQPSLTNEATVVKYIVPKDYPEKTKKHKLIVSDRLLWNNGARCYYEDVSNEKGVLYSGSNRSLAVFASGKDIDEAQTRAEAASKFAVSGKVRHRRDIGKEEIILRKMTRMNKIRSFWLKIKNIIRK